MRLGSRLLLAGVVVGLGAAAWWTFWPRRENVILITIDTMRPDRISAYGYQKHQTPNLDRLAKEGTLFENAFCDVTWTTQSMASVMTGMYATRHGLRSSFQTLKPEAETLAEIVRDQGWDTAAIIASYPLHSLFGLNQGFKLYDENFTTALTLDERVEFGPQPAFEGMEVPASDDAEAMRWFLMLKSQREAYRPDDQVSDRAIAWLRNAHKDPFFLWIHYFGPHEKPTGLVGLGHAAEERQIQLAAYDPDVVTVDREIGRVLDALDDLWLTRNTVVIVHADHGQSLMEHDYFGHGQHVFDATAHIPLIVRAPGLVQLGKRDARLARNVDILPTVLGLLGVPNPIAGDGTNLFMADPKPDAAAYIETYLSATRLFADVIDPATDARLGFRRMAMRTSRWKLVINDPIPLIDEPDGPVPDDLRRLYYKAELYDLTTDPEETIDRILEQPALAEELRLAIWREQATEPTGSDDMPMNSTTRERLKALGYLAP
ncbi:MAG: sulfatase [Candidatus Binatia bacterium]